MPFRVPPIYPMGKQRRNQHYLSQTKNSCPGRMPFTPSLVYRCQWVFSIQINPIRVKLRQVQSEIDTKGTTTRSLKPITTSLMNHLGRSQMTDPLAMIRAWPGSVPATTHELARYGEPRRRTYIRAARIVGGDAPTPLSTEPSLTLRDSKVY